jgi:hypothetical protein
MKAITTGMIVYCVVCVVVVVAVSLYRGIRYKRALKRSANWTDSTPRLGQDKQTASTDNPPHGASPTKHAA